MDTVLLACFSSISKELWLKDSNYLSPIYPTCNGVRHRITTANIPVKKKKKGGGGMGGHSCHCSMAVLKFSWARLVGPLIRAQIYSQAAVFPSCKIYLSQHLASLPVLFCLFHKK